MNSSEIKRNKGEWSEQYILLKLLYKKEIAFGDPHFSALPQKVKLLSLSTLTDDHSIHILPDSEIAIANKNTNQVTKTLAISDVFTEKDLNQVHDLIIYGEGRSFIDPANIVHRIFSQLGIKNEKARGDSKVDIYISFSHEGQSYESDPVGVKSYLGNPPTLVNASRATMFKYKVGGLGQDINIIKQQLKGYKQKSLIQQILALSGKIEFVCVKDKIYEANLIKVDSLMPNLIGKILLDYFSSKGKAKISDLIDSEINKIHIKRFLLESLLGILPHSEWNGKRIANGSIELNHDDHLLFYHVVKQDIFEDFLFLNTKLDSPHDRPQTPYGSLYKEGNEIYIDLCLQVRFR
jgi:DNA (cytosine-5)-methyltransferase 1